jgi:hypothetical protein
MGEVFVVRLGTRTDPVARFWSYVGFTDCCWNWRGGANSKGYASFWLEGKTIMAYRYSYELLREPIPEGLHIDHLCRNPLCVNPDHLEPVTLAENVLRGQGITARNARSIVCPYGHPREGNTYITPQGWRRCGVCKRQRLREWRANKKAV